jgi:hypothetical protein
MVAAIAGRGGRDAEAEVGAAPEDVTSRRDAASLLEQIRYSPESTLHLNVLVCVVATVLAGKGGGELRSTGSSPGELPHDCLHWRGKQALQLRMSLPQRVKVQTLCCVGTLQYEESREAFKSTQYVCTDDSTPVCSPPSPAARCSPTATNSLSTSAAD